jgi:hypothetical protein
MGRCAIDHRLAATMLSIERWILSLADVARSSPDVRLNSESGHPKSFQYFLKCLLTRQRYFHTY